MMFLGGTDLKWFGYGAIAVGVFAFLYLKFMGYASARVTAWRDPPPEPGRRRLFRFCSRSMPSVQVGSWGSALAGAGRNISIFPRSTTTTFSRSSARSSALWAAMVVLVLFMLLIIRGYWIAMHARDRFGALMAAGLTTHLALQVFLNIGVVTNFLPATGISLPFFSYAGTALLIQLFEVGMF